MTDEATRPPRLGKVRAVSTTLLAAAVYGFSIGASKNLTYAWRSAIKVPLLLLGTGAICAVAWYVAAQFTGVRLSWAAVQRATFGQLRTLAVLLASLGPATAFLGQTMTAPTEGSLGGYPGFVAVNLIFIAIAGSFSVLLQARALRLEHRLPLHRGDALVAIWLLLSLAVGGQLAFYLRPFFGIASLHGAPPFLLGDEPTVTGARNFYEFVWQLVAPP